MSERLPLVKIAGKIIHTKYLSRWIVMTFDVLLSATVSVFVYCFISYLGGKPINGYVFWHILILSAIISCATLAILKAYRVVMRFTTLRETWRIGFSMFLKVLVLYPVLHLLYPSFSSELVIRMVFQPCFSHLRSTSTRSFFTSSSNRPSVINT